MEWTELREHDQVEKILSESNEKRILIFKHSTRCSISRTVLDRLERNWKEAEMTSVKPYFLDLLSYRGISNYLAEKFQVEHESPQVLIIENGQSVHQLSHLEIDYNRIKEFSKN